MDWSFFWKDLPVREWKGSLSEKERESLSLLAEGGEPKEKEGLLILMGFEFHMRLATGRKLFSGVTAGEAGECDAGLPGSLPELDVEAWLLARRLGRRLKAEVRDEIWFDRKRYGYPDLPKGFQTTQTGGCAFFGGSLTFKGVTMEFERGQIEEDAAATKRSYGCSEVDLSRSGAPLVELVSMPVEILPSMVAPLCKRTRDIALFAGVTEGRPEMAEFKTDVCVSLGSEGVRGQRIEIKGVAGFEEAREAAREALCALAWLALEGLEPEKPLTAGYEPERGLFPQRMKLDGLYRFLPCSDLGVLSWDEFELREDQKEMEEAFGALPDLREVDDAAAESLTLLVSGMGAEDAEGKTAAALFSTSGKGIPTSPKGRLAAARAVAWASRTGKGRRESIAAALAGLSQERFDEKAAYSFLQESSASAEKAASSIGTVLDEILSTKEGERAATEARAGKEKALGLIVGMLRKKLPGADPGEISKMVRSRVMTSDKGE